MSDDKKPTPRTNILLLSLRKLEEQIYPTHINISFLAHISNIFLTTELQLKKTSF